MIPIQDFIANPYNDNYMTYNKVFHRYSISLEYFAKALGDDEIITKLGGNDNAEWMLNHTSEVTYAVIDSYTDSKYRDKMRYYFSHSKRLREWLLKTMIDVLIYDESDGGLYTAYATGINFNEMKAFDMILTNYVGRMAQQIMINGGLAERVMRYDLDRLSNEFYTLNEALVYMDVKGYININDYYDVYTINSDGTNFDYNEIRVLFNADRFVATQNPITFVDDEVKYYILHNLFSDRIYFQFEEGYYFELLNNDKVSGNPIQDTQFKLYFTKEDKVKLLPNSKKYSLVPNGNGGYVLHEFGFWQQCLNEKGVNW